VLPFGQCFEAIEAMDCSEVLSNPQEDAREIRITVVVVVKDTAVSYKTLRRFREESGLLLGGSSVR